MIGLDIDTSDLSAEFSLNQQDVDGLLSYCVQEVASQFAKSWEGEAKANLNSSRNEYINNIFIEERDPKTIAVYLNPAAWLPNAIEMGASEFDMKSGLLMSDKVKYDKHGLPYITVPFRHATPSALGESTAFSSVMPTEVYKEAKKMPKGSKQQLPLNKIPSKYHIPQNMARRKEFKNKNFEKINEKTKMTSVYEGMQRTEGGYVTFRRVSLASDSERWIHPGFEKRDFATKALHKIDAPDIVDKAIDNYLSKLGF